MKFFKPAAYENAFLKMGLQGGPGSGKSFTAALIARGLHKHIKSDRPVGMIDTEGASDHLVADFKAAGVPFVVLKSRSFLDLKDGLDEAADNADVCIVDNVTLLWFDFVTSYKDNKGIDVLSAQDWVALKEIWKREFIDPRFVCAPLHLIITGRAGFEYQDEEDADGRLELKKTGVKMRGENEVGYEPSLLLEMEVVRTRTARGLQILNVGTVVKDRDNLVSGSRFENPKFEDFLPVVKKLNIGGRAAGVNLARDSKEAFSSRRNPDVARFFTDRKRRRILTDIIEEELRRAHPGQGGADKKGRADILEKVWGTRSFVELSEDTVKYPPELLEMKTDALKTEVLNVVTHVTPPAKGRKPGSKNKRGPGRPKKKKPPAKKRAVGRPPKRPHDKLNG